jgi:predicted nucleotidyltransferase
MMLDLKPDYQKMVQRILQTYLPGKTVWVYGSRINGQSHDGSDLDLVVKSPVTVDELSRVRAAFSDSHIPISVDILDWENIPAAFKIEIEKAHQVFPL